MNLVMNDTSFSTCGSVTALYSDVRIPSPRQLGGQDGEHSPPTLRCPATPMIPSFSASTIKRFSSTSRSFPAPLRRKVTFILLLLPCLAVAT